MNIEKGKGIILRKTLYGDADIIFEVFSKENGKISILAKGIRKQLSQNKSSMQLFSYIEYEVFLFSEKGNFFRLKRASTLRSLRDTSFEAQTICALLSEISLPFVASEESFTKVFLLWDEFLEKGVFTKKITLAFIIRLFSDLGMFPDFSCLSDCGTRLTGNESIYWEREKGLFLSSEGLVSYKKIPFVLLKVFSFASKTSLLQLEVVQFSRSQEQEMWDIVWWFYTGHSSFFPRSKKLFENMS